MFRAFLTTIAALLLVAVKAFSLIVLCAVALAGCMTAEYKAVIGEQAKKAAAGNFNTTYWRHCRSQSSGYVIDMSVGARNSFIAYCGGKTNEPDPPTPPLKAAANEESAATP
ncbi:MAG: hypothetical protein AAGI44_18285 [Pseudomonadota bacterium]